MSEWVHQDPRTLFLPVGIYSPYIEMYQLDVVIDGQETYRERIRRVGNQQTGLFESQI